MKLLGIALAMAAVATPAAATAQSLPYGIPGDNPFVTTAGARPEVFAYGLRNPFRWSFDRQTGDMLIGDVGGSQVEEITHLPHAFIAGANLGWNCFEGTLAGPGGCSVPGTVGPVYEYPNPAAGFSAVTGGYVVRDPALPSFEGRYLFGDFFADPFGGEIQVLTVGPGATPTNAGETVASLVAFGEDYGGGLYAVSLNGPVYRLSESGGLLDATSIGDFVQPMAVAPVPGDPSRLFVVERAGVLKLRVDAVAHDFLDLSALVATNGERGLLAAAAAPDYPSSGRVFVFYADNDGDLQLDEFRRSAADPLRADPATRRPLLTIEHSSAANHNGGQLLFGPADGLLYLSTGDGGSQGDPEGDAQNLGSLLGKVLRIDVSGSGGVGGGAGGGGAGGGTPATTRDATEPALRTRVPARQRVLALRGAVAYARCSERCRVTAGGWLKIGSRIHRLRRTTSRSVAAGERVRLKAKLRRAGRRALRDALRDGRRPRVRIGLRARDLAGNPSQLARRTVRVKR